MPVESQAGLIEALARGDHDAVLGTPESHWVDFKRDPYRLETPKDQWELAKDVAAMAETRGGIVVIGYEIEKLLNEGIEVAVKHHPVPKNLIAPERYRDIVQSRVYPHVAGIQTHWYPPGEAEVKGVFVIEIPAQPDDSKPFAVTRMLDENDAERAHFVGFPRRDGDRVSWMKPEAIHHQLNIGRRLNALGALEPETISRDDLDAELAATVEAADAEDEPWLAYQAALTSIVGRRRDPLVLERMRSVLADPPSLRSGGFNFRNARGPEWVGGSVLQLVGRASLRLSDVGILTACLPANEECLGWALSQHLREGAPLRINPLTLTEYTLEYFRLLDNQIAPIYERAHWTARVVARGLHRHLVVLEPGPLRDSGIPLTPPTTRYIAQTDEWDSEFDCAGDSERDAYHALVRAYALFGLKESSIPYAEDGRISSSIIVES